MMSPFDDQKKGTEIVENAEIPCDLLALLMLPPKAQQFLRNHLNMKVTIVNGFAWTNIGYIFDGENRGKLIHICTHRAQYIWVYNPELFLYELYYHAPGADMIGPILSSSDFLDLLTEIYTLQIEQLSEHLGDFIENNKCTGCSTSA